MEMPKFSRWLCIGTAIVLLAVSVLLAILQSTELQLGCLLGTPEPGRPISAGGQAGSVIISFLGLQHGCGRASARYSGGTTPFKLRSVLPNIHGSVTGKAGLEPNDASSAALKGIEQKRDSPGAAEDAAFPGTDDSSTAPADVSIPLPTESPATSAEQLRIVQWPENSGVVLDSVPEGTPHARDCDVCDECLLSEPPKVRYEYDNWKAPDQQELLRSQVTDKPASKATGTASGRSLLNQDSLGDALARPSWEWGDSLLAVSAKAGHDERFLQERSAQGDGEPSGEQKQTAVENRHRPMHEHIIYTLPDSKTRFGKRTHSHCKRCYGCAHKLSYIEDPVEVMNRVWERESGGTAAHIFRARHPNSRTGYAVAKVLCMPFGKRGYEHLSPDCSEDSNEDRRTGPCLHMASSWQLDTTFYSNLIVELFQGTCGPYNCMQSAITTAMAQGKLAHDCGFEEIIPRMWLGPVNAFSPNGSRFLQWDALWTEEAPGISLDKLSLASAPIVGSNETAFVDREYLEELLLKKLDSKKVVLSALWDLITLQCDRHGQNVFLDDSATLTLIDLDQALGDAWRKCSFDSIFLPTSQKHAITTFGFWYTMKLPVDKPTKEPGPLGIQHVLDYRCHAPGGKIARNYPQKFEQCLKRISSSTYRQVQQEFGFSRIHKAVGLHQRASDLLHKGFEWTLINGEPKNEWPHRYPIMPACCSVHFKGTNSECMQKYTSWVPHNDTLNCGDTSTGANPAANVNEQECLDPDGRRRSGYWQQDDRKIVPVSSSSGAKWEVVSDPDWIKRDRYRFAGIWEDQTPDADFLVD